MKALLVFRVLLAIVALIGLSLAVTVVTQYRRVVLLRLGQGRGVKEPGILMIDRLVRRNGD